jgi:hypothetical protein
MVRVIYALEPPYSNDELSGLPLPAKLNGWKDINFTFKV